MVHVIIFVIKYMTTLKLIEWLFPATSLTPSHIPIDITQSLIDTFLHTLVILDVNDDNLDNTTHISHIGPITYIKIKSYQLTSLGHLRLSIQLSFCLALAHKNHWADQKAELLHSVKHSHWFFLPCSQHRIRMPLYTHPFTLTFYYELCPIDTDVPSVIHHSYQHELISYLASRSEMGWFARHHHNLPAPNSKIGYMGTIRSLITH